MNLLREWVRTVGALPMLLMLIGLALLFRGSRSAWLPLLAGIAWGGFNVLFAKREISTVVDIADGATFDSKTRHYVETTESG